MSRSSSLTTGLWKHLLGDGKFLGTAAHSLRPTRRCNIHYNQLKSAREMPFPQARFYPAQ